MDTFQNKIKYGFLDFKRIVTSKYNQLKYDITGGFKCKCCGKLIPTLGNEISAKVNGKSFILSSAHTGARCAACTVKAIELYFAVPSLPSSDRYDGEFRSKRTRKCDWFGHRRKCIKGIMQYNNKIAVELDLDIRIGQNYWNGFYASMEVFKIALTEGLYSSSTFSHSKGITKMSVGNGVSLIVSSDGVKIK